MLKSRNIYGVIIMNTMTWYYLKNGIKEGPVDEQFIRDMLFSGIFPLHLMIMNDEMENWQKAASISPFKEIIEYKYKKRKLLSFPNALCLILIMITFVKYYNKSLIVGFFGFCLIPVLFGISWVLVKGEAKFVRFFYIVATLFFIFIIFHA